MKSLLTVFGAIVCTATFGIQAQAAPILGDQLYYTGGDVTVESLPVSSGYVSELGLYDSLFGRLLNIMNDEPVGVSVTFNPGVDFGILPGAELIFGIRVLDTGDEFFMGPASRNPDSILHASVDDLGGGTLHVSFEDILGGGDRDYNDNRFAFTQGVAPDPHGVPEPATFGLLALGLIPIGYLRSRRSR